jgi:hypothetical protein
VPYFSWCLLRLCLPVAHGLFFPTSSFVLLARYLVLLALSTPRAIPRPPYGYPTMLRSNSTIATPYLDPSFLVATYCGAMIGSLLSAQTLG